MRKIPKIGDKVRRVGGEAIQTVYDLSFSAQVVYATYDAYGKDYYLKGQALTDLIVVEEGEEEMATLYEFTVNGTKTYGHKLAVNSKGEWVMEEKSGGGVFPVDKKKVEEVIPYTVDIHFANDYDDTATYSYLATEGQFSVDDLLFLNTPVTKTMAVVVAVNTKSKKATKNLSEEAIGRVSLDTSFKN